MRWKQDDNGLVTTVRIGQAEDVKSCRILPAVCAALASLAMLSPGAELPEPLKSAAARFDADMKAIETSETTQGLMARDAYVQTLLLARRLAEGAKQAAEVAAIDSDIEALKKGTLPQQPPANLPLPVAAARLQYLTALARAAASAEPVRRGTRERYLKYLAGLESVVRGKDAALEKALAQEIQRVSALAEKARQ